ncbi:TA system toxin CbtA family protein [Yersinia aldovae]|uniref:Ypjf toxin protein n=1 Tax=Yersinia aldovae TaxID=29483 RepID=A0ABM9SYJ4_YERAL|nr:TA system toxin CbtA family protein [Yersinia aldovae]CNL80550.1 ypjf toxin protein [Yersinia aldovae]
MNQEQQFWQLTASALLSRHFGLTLNDTDFCEEACVVALSDAGIRPFEAINTLVDKYHLARQNDNAFQSLSPYLNAVNELIAALETGATLDIIRQP